MHVRVRLNRDLDSLLANDNEICHVLVDLQLQLGREVQQAEGHIRPLDQSVICSRIFDRA